METGFLTEKKTFFTSAVNVHCIGIGGIGMCGLAELLHHSGSVITGSDLVANTQIHRLQKLGITITIGHSEDNIQNANIVIFSSAIPKKNVELCLARKRGIPVISRSEALAEIMRLKRGIVVAGTHGKTTTTGFLANIFIHNDKDPTIMIGGKSHLFESTARSGKGEWFIAESDESDGGFKYLFPEIAVLTNIDHDHVDHYGSFEQLKRAFHDFANKVPFYGCIVALGDQKNLRDILTGLKQKVIFYGFNENNHFVLKKNKNLQYQVFVNQQNLGTLNMPLPGSMNALNTLAACATAMTVGCSFEDCCNSFKNFQGIDRRFQKKGCVKGIDFYDDYAHHPTEIKCVLSAFREQYGHDRRLIVLFQPHRFSRTVACWSDFLTCFKEADKLFLIDIYPSSESPLKDVSSSRLAQEIQHSACLYCSEENIFPAILNDLKKGDVMITIGAGSVYHYGSQLMEKLQSK